MNSPSLISDKYREMNQQLHDSHEHYGAGGHRWAGVIRELAANHRLGQVLDYGCGKQTLKAALPDVQVLGYDPALPELAGTPAPADLVFCGDVLEHVEPDFVESVLDDLQRVTRGYGLFVISTQPAKKILPDGRNAHLSLLPVSQWASLLAQRFDLIYLLDYLPELKRKTWKNRIARWALKDIRAAIPKRGEVVFLVRSRNFLESGTP